MSDDRERNEQGKYVKSRSPQEVLEAMDLFEPYTSTELADELDWPRRTVYQVLQDLHEDDNLRKKKTGERTVVWIRTDEGAQDQSEGEETDMNTDSEDSNDEQDVSPSPEEQNESDGDVHPWVQAGKEEDQ